MPPIYSTASYALDDAILFSRVLARYRSAPLKSVFETYDQLRRSTVDRAFAECNGIWKRMKDRGHMEEFVKEWKMSSYLRHCQNKREEGWMSDPAKIPIPTPTPEPSKILVTSEILVST